jgi:hypothetical protein
MASFNDQARAASDPKLVLPITGGSCSEPANKKQTQQQYATLSAATVIFGGQRVAAENCGLFSVV